MKTVKKPSKLKHAVYLILALAMLVYALPMITFNSGATFVSIFGIVWAAFAFLVIGAHLYYLLGVNEEKERALDAIRREKARQWQHKLADDAE